MRIQAYTQACALSEHGPEPLHEDQRAEIKTAGGVTDGLGSRASQMHGDLCRPSHKHKGKPGHGAFVLEIQSIWCSIVYLLPHLCILTFIEYLLFVGGHASATGERKIRKSIRKKGTWIISSPLSLQ